MTAGRSYSGDLQLLTREQFRAFGMSHYKSTCIICYERAADVHHILNRNLFSEADEGGYYRGNAAPLCAIHHLDAERTLINPNKLAAYTDYPMVYPYTFSLDKSYDTWGNEIVDEFTRLPGPLFEDEGCQRALSAGRVLWMFQLPLEDEPDPA